MTLFWVIVILLIGYWRMIYMPGQSYTGPLPQLTAHQQRSAVALEQDVRHLASDIGPRHSENAVQLDQAAAYIAQSLESAGWTVERQSFQANGTTCTNIIAERVGAQTPEEIVVVGAHYDTVPGCPGANDNTTGTAAVLELGRRFSHTKSARTLRLCAFVNEEPPHFQTDTMGSLVYARRCQERGERVVGMLSLETLGSYSDAEGSQDYPFPFALFYPTEGNFVAFVGNLSSRTLVHRTLQTFRSHAEFPSEGVSAPTNIPGVGWSDHWSFWEAGFDAVMITDTAPFRYAHYHSPEDTVDKIDFERLARVVSGVEQVITDLVDGP
jgi:Zn-dependent M28 family amino/carboxypeptidase